MYFLMWFPLHEEGVGMKSLDYVYFFYEIVFFVFINFVLHLVAYFKRSHTVEREMSFLLIK